jgi:esterase/lipase
MDCSEHLKECAFNNLKETLIEKEMFQEEIFKINKNLMETNQKLNDFIVSSKINQNKISERLGIHLNLSKDLLDENLVKIFFFHVTTHKSSLLFLLYG